MRDAGEDYKNVLLALKFGGVPSINNINAIYNFQASDVKKEEEREGRESSKKSDEMLRSSNKRERGKGHEVKIKLMKKTAQ